jgi:multiple sugar transport system substrate-binding protein
MSEHKQSSLSRRDFLKRAAVTAGAAASGLTGTAISLARPTQQDTVHVRSMIINPARVDAFLNIMPNFYDANPNVEVEFVGIAAAEWDEFLSKVSVILASGQQLDSLEVGAEGFQLFTSNGIIRALDEYVVADPDMPNFFSDVSPSMIESQMYEGSLYNLPFLWAASGIHYNKRLFDQAGLDYPTNDWTLEDFLAAVRAISALGDDVYGYAWPNRQWGGFVVWSYANATNIVQTEKADGGDWLWDKFYPDLTEEQRAQRNGGWRYAATSANDANNVEALQMLQDLAFVEDASYMVGPGGLPDLFNAFTTDKLGMMVSHRAWNATYQGAGMTPDDYDVVFHPRWKAQKSAFGASGLAVTTLSRNPDEAFALLKHLTSPETQSVFIAGGTHTASRRSVTNAPDQNEGITPSNWRAYYAMLDELDSEPVTAPPQNRDYTNALVKWFSLAMSNEATAQEALDGLQEELTRVLGV